MAWTSDLRRLAHHLQGFLPITLLGTLVLMTYWLVQNSPIWADASPEPHTSAKPDAYFHRFRIVRFDEQGQWLLQITGDRAQHLSQEDRYEIDQPRMLRRSQADGPPMRMSADRAVARDEGKTLELIGEAVIEQDPYIDALGIKRPVQEVRSQYLLLDEPRQVVQTHLPVTLIRGSDVFKADQMLALQKENRLELAGRVRGTLAPRP